MTMNNRKLTSIEALRDHVLEALEKLEARELEVEEVGIIAKASETVMSSLKIQLAYASMQGERPEIEFLSQHTKTKLIEDVIKDE